MYLGGCPPLSPVTHISHLAITIFPISFDSILWRSPDAGGLKKENICFVG